ncbi:hypothetical protein UFOVP42_31 [uncultured Caudovirales phage]|uniref:Phage tail collar domain containing protein n=1 Tax=uncultured Caudovirales phage TaxID=2100421 RepID=A0A6J5KQ54_9CAUD|nr:hypothetical protein UFOVP42_31 [uncultured Caudovirales phage]
MASVNLSPLFNGITSFDSTGNILAGGLLYTYQAGSSTPLATYTTVDGDIANANPIVLGTDGKLPSEMWLQTGYSYKFVLETSANVLVDTYDNIAGILTSIPSSSSTLPTGVILLWSGSIGAIPSGYLLCNGTNGTPDLRNSFIVGAGNTYAVAQTGGSADSVVIAHTHTATSTSTVTDPGHVHDATGTVLLGGGGSGFNWDNGLGAARAVLSAVTGISVATSTTNTSTGVSGTDKNLPPYYALAYIMKS